MTDPIALDARTTRQSLPLLYPGQAQKEIFVNEALARLDALAQPVVHASRAAPPVSHEAGDTFLIVGPASDPWSGREDSLAISQGTHWMYQTPFEGMRVYDRERAAIRVWRNGWSAPEPIPDPTGGSTIDAEARGAIATLLESLRALGILPAN